MTQPLNLAYRDTTEERSFLLLCRDQLVTSDVTEIKVMKAYADKDEFLITLYHPGDDRDGMPVVTEQNTLWDGLGTTPLPAAETWQRRYTRKPGEIVFRCIRASIWGETLETLTLSADSATIDHEHHRLPGAEKPWRKNFLSALGPLTKEQEEISRQYEKIVDDDFAKLGTLLDKQHYVRCEL